MKTSLILAAGGIGYFSSILAEFLTAGTDTPTGLVVFLLIVAGMSVATVILRD
jgi:hypothetical protein|tara:strand:+ start:274 stop:432 length:159 start_codon:yes stop_codon:yes gene_type:complete